MRTSSRRRWALAAVLPAASVIFSIAGGASPAVAETAALTAGDLPPIFLHGTAGTPSVLTLDTTAPTAASPKFKDSASVVFGGGNPWKEIGTWTAAASPLTGPVSGLNPLHVFAGLKSSDDEGARFDLRAEIFRNGSPLTAGQTLCATGVTRNPDNASEILISFGAFPEVTFTPADAMSVKVMARVGTNGTGSTCGGHGGAAGLRLYFDWVLRPSRIEGPSVEGLDWNTAIGGNPNRASLSRAVGPTAPSIAWQAGFNASFFSPSVTGSGLAVFSTGYGVIEARDLGTGALLWTAGIPTVFQGNVRVDAIREGQVYATAANGPFLDYLYSLNAANGSLLWRSRDKIGESMEENIAFTANGDLVVGGSYSLSRINHLNGATVWKADRFCQGNGGCMAAVLGDRIYTWDMNAGRVANVVSVFAAASGQKLYSSADLGSGGSQTGLVLGPDATIYSPLTAGGTAPTFIALRDTGSALIEKWRIPMAWTPFASYGIGPDGSVYMYSADNRILRLDPATGLTRNSSIPIPSGHAGYFYPRIAIDSAGMVFLTNREDMVFSFDPDLTLRWSENLSAVFPSGLAIARDGTLIVTSFEGLRAYRTP